MTNTKNKTKAATTLFLISTIALTLFALQPANAQTVVGTKKTYAMIGAMPNPVGVGQETLLWIGISDQLQTASHGWEGLTVTVEKPDGTKTTLGPFRTDSTGSMGYSFTPTVAGTYYLQTNFPAQWYNYTTNRIYYEASTSEKYPLNVTEEKVVYHPASPLPNFYWTRPIDAQHREWSTISGNWLGTFQFSDNLAGAVAPYNDDAPDSPHVLWTKPLVAGGLVGGEVGIHGYEDGDAYEGFFAGTVIMNGKLYYNRFNSNGGARVEQEIVCVDLHTGEELWVRNHNNSRIAFGQNFYWESYNYMGTFDYLWITNGTTWQAFDALTGRWEYTMINVPSGTTVVGPKA